MYRFFPYTPVSYTHLLTSSPAIGVLVAGMLKDKLNLQEDPTFNGTRKGVTHLNSCTKEERDALIKENPAYGSIVCRCEMITEGEILDAIHRPLGATTLDGIKRRTRCLLYTSQVFKKVIS